jgi:hypothetical protein
MSCTVPINIVRQQTNKCNLKCKLWYKYGNSSCLFQNKKDHIVIVYDGESDVMFNSVPYKPIDIKIFKPSIHTYDGVYADGEIIIQHTGGQAGLLICIPIIVSNESADGTKLLEDIIKNGKTDEITTLNIQDFNANHLIPKSSYFSYVGPLPFGTCSPDSLVQYVVFHKSHGNLKLNQSTMDDLGKLIHDSYIPIYEGTSYFNEKGTTQNGFNGDGEIYIDCQPTGEDEEIVYLDTSSSTTKPLNLDWIKTVMFVVVGIIIAILLYKLFSFVLYGNEKSASESTKESYT